MRVDGFSMGVQLTYVVFGVTLWQRLRFLNGERVLQTYVTNRRGAKCTNFSKIKDSENFYLILEM